MKLIKLVINTLILTFSLISNSFAQFDFFEPETKFGGYGEMHYNYKKAEEKDATKTLDFHRFVLFYSHAWSEKWSFQAEVELEHNFIQEGHGELELEQAHINYYHAPWFGFRAGVILNSVGMVNETHEPPTFLSVERQDYNKYIIPTTWFGNGLALFGTYKNFDYTVTVMEGLNADGISAKGGIRGARQKGFKADAENLLYNARVDYLGIQGLKVGTSFSYNDATGDSINNTVNLFEAHLAYTAHNLVVMAEFGNITYDTGDLESSRGYYLDLGYNVGPLLKWKTALIPFIRYSDYNTAASTKTGGDSEKQYHNTQWMIGVSIKPLPQVAFKIDYSQNTVELGDAKTDFFNIGVGYMF